MTKPGDYAAFWDTLSHVYDKLWSREEAKRSELAPLRSDSSILRSGDLGPGGERAIAAVELEAELGELSRVLELLDAVLRDAFPTAMADHHNQAHPSTATPEAMGTDRP